MNVARRIFRHPRGAGCDRPIKKIREELNLPVAILLDTKGPEYRSHVPGQEDLLREGDLFTFDTQDVPGDRHGSR